ncbi:MAG TPA: ribosome small subunit-dependent GTPase A [Longilinea sp.]|nr:ribosome small subunit-dependent GTPase A [Longilinea sp.]
MKFATIPGQVTCLQSGFYTVKTGQGAVTCFLRGRLKRRNYSGDVIAIGDWVQISLQVDGTGAIEEIVPRRNALVRLDPTPKGAYQQILLANPDQVVLVFACAQPAPHLRMLDRFLVIAEKANLPALIVANKLDLVGMREARKLFSIYPPLGYEVLFTSAKQSKGVDALRRHLEGKLSALAGPSGVGKSSLLNTIQPELGLAAGEVNQYSGRGRHTTIVRQMYPLQGGGFVADLPGLRSLALWDTQPEELDGYFPELRDLVEHCQFNDCTHRNEPGCAVRRAVEEGTVRYERYESYLRLRFGEE